MAADAAARYPLRRIIGRDAGLAPALALAARVANKALPVLVAGERGTGKELVARYLHAESKRSGPFLRLGCSEVCAERMDEELFGSERDGVVVRGRLESASRGTLFLDDIAELSLAIQAELAHALDEGCFERVGGQTPVPLSARVVAATHRDVPVLVRADRFSAQLQYHFNVVVPLPALRERGADIAQLALHFADKHTAAGEVPRRIDDDALVALAAYAWPGNVRELESIVARAVALAEGPSLTVDDFTFRLDLPSDAELSLRQEAKASEALELRRLLLAHGGNLASAARALGIPRTTLLGRAKKLGLLS